MNTNKKKRRKFVHVCPGHAEQVTNFHRNFSVKSGPCHFCGVAAFSYRGEVK